jgi:hemoglobin/transferrin/lactoferrin receptor protein
MKKVVTLLVISLFSHSLLHADETILLKVLSAETGNPVAGARVSTEDAVLVTNESGRVRIPANVAYVTVTHPAYERKRVYKSEFLASEYVISLEPRVFSDTVVITGANRREQVLADSAVRVEQVGREQVDIANPQTAADLLDISESVYIQKSQMGGGSPMIRGFSTNRVLIVVDGIRMNNAIFRSGNVHNVISVDPNMIDATEIVYGPGSVIYGSDAIGGVMAFSTFKPDFATKGLRTEGSLFSRFSSANSEATTSARFGLASTDWSASFGASFSRYGDLSMGSNGMPEYRRLEYVVPSVKGDTIVEIRTLIGSATVVMNKGILPVT